MGNNKLVLWDIDGTLLHCGSDGRKALNRTFFELYNIDDAFRGANIGGAMDSRIFKSIMDHFEIPEEDTPRIKDLYGSVLAGIIAGNDEKRLLPGVVEALKAVEASGAHNGLLTSNFEVGAMTKLKAFGLEKYFKVGGFGDDDGEKWDEALRCIRRAEELFLTSFRLEDIWLVGDSVYDIECAEKLGINSMAVATGWVKYEELESKNPCCIFKDLSDTEKVTGALLK